jgi:endonuclease-3
VKKPDVFEFFRRLAELNPEPETELEYRDPYTLLVAVALSAQATDVSVNLATRKLFELADTPGRMVALGEDGVKAHIKTIGLFNTKAKNVIALSEKLLAEHGGKVPQDRAALESLPGVGRKTANVVLGHALGVPGLPVDRHVLRVAGRIGLVHSDDPERVEATLSALLPPERWTRASDALILHGRRICKPKPLCDRCQLRSDCAYFLALAPAALPARRRTRQVP